MFNSLLDFIKQHTGDLIMLWGAFITLLYVIVRLTPSKKDDEILENVLKVLNVLKINPLEDEQQQEETKEKVEQLIADLEEETNEKDNDKSRTNIINAIK